MQLSTIERESKHERERERGREKASKQAYDSANATIN
jgi:hypothetical protein